MPIALYMNEHVPRVITIGLRLRITAQEDGAGGISDPELLDRAARLQRVLFTHDDDLLAEAAKRQRQGMPFQRLIYAHPLRVSIGTCIHDLEIIAKAGEPEDMVNRKERR